MTRYWETRNFGECAFPTDVGDKIHSCCEPVEGERPYCTAHCKVMYAPTPPKRMHRRTS